MAKRKSDYVLQLSDAFSSFFNFFACYKIMSLHMAIASRQLINLHNYQCMSLISRCLNRLVIISWQLKQKQVAILKQVIIKSRREILT